MNILADENIPLVFDYFSEFGNVRVLPGRSISAKDVADTNILLVRSVTTVDKALLDQSPVSFVGSCTIGTDHLDTDYLESNSIVWANAPGCNAEAVVQYALSAMAQLRPNWLDLKVGIIGCGNVGGRLYRRLKKLGVDCQCYDPFLSASDCADLTALDKLLATSDIISCHTPLTTSGQHPTYHMLDHAALEGLKPDALLINCGRGGLIDTNALLLLSPQRPEWSLALDVWEYEPNIPLELLPHVDLATPHIAGYSLEGKRNGTVMIYQALHEFLQGIPAKNLQRWPSEALQILSNPVAFGITSDAEQLNALLLEAYNIVADDQRMRDIIQSKDAGVFFDTLRKEYPIRRDYCGYAPPASAKKKPLSTWLAALAFGSN